jgi:hypothetical protein
MLIASVTWSSELPLLLESAKEVGLDLEAWSSSQLAEAQYRKNVSNPSKELK